MRMRTLFRSAALAALLASIPAAAPAFAQEAAPAAEAPPPAAAATQPAEAPSAEATQSLRRTAEGSGIARPPRTLRAYWHVFIAFTLAWVLLFGYVLSLGRRFRRLEGEVDALARA